MTYTAADKLSYSADLGNIVLKAPHGSPKVQQFINDIYAMFKWAPSERFMPKLIAHGYESPKAKKVEVAVTDANDTSVVDETPVSTFSRKRQFDAYVAKKYAEKYANAEKRGIEFDLSFTDFKKLLSSNTCAYTGVTLTPIKGANIEDNSLTIERVDSSKGYVKGNVVLASYKANQWKSIVMECPNGKIPTLSIDEMINMLTKIKGLTK